MLELLKVKDLLKSNKIENDSVIFRLHYSFTVVILMTFCVIVTTKQYVGDPVICTQIRDIPASLLNTYCWVYGTFTIENNTQMEIYPGVSSNDNEKDFKYQKYYQWVCFLLFFQSILFYIPHWLWKHWERGTMEVISVKVNELICDEGERRKNVKEVIEFLLRTLGNHNWYVFSYYTCELASFLNVTLQMFLVDLFLDGQFLNYGIEVIRYNVGIENVDPMVKIFPRTTKCQYYYYGSSGNIMKVDPVCILPLNIVNEKIFIFLWFWFVILAFLSGFCLLYRTLLISSNKIRFLVFALRYRVRKPCLAILVSRISLGDWFIIYMLGKNMYRVTFMEIISEYWRKILSKDTSL